VGRCPLWEKVDEVVPDDNDTIKAIRVARMPNLRSRKPCGNLATQLQPGLEPDDWPFAADEIIDIKCGEGYDLPDLTPQGKLRDYELYNIRRRYELQRGSRDHRGTACAHATKLKARVLECSWEEGRFCGPIAYRLPKRAAVGR
jgi:hypothetical protein